MNVIYIYIERDVYIYIYIHTFIVHYIIAYYNISIYTSVYPSVVQCVIVPDVAHDIMYCTQSYLSKGIIMTTGHRPPMAPPRILACADSYGALRIHGIRQRDLRFVRGHVII